MVDGQVEIEVQEQIHGVSTKPCNVTEEDSPGDREHEVQ